MIGRRSAPEVPHRTGMERPRGVSERNLMRRVVVHVRCCGAPAPSRRNTPAARQSELRDGQVVVAIAG